MSESKSPEETKMDKSSEVLCETFAALQARELKLKEHLAIALKSQKLANEQYEKEREAREAIEKMFRELSEKCDKVKEENLSDKKSLFNSFTEQSEKIDAQINEVTKENKELLAENNRFRERLCQLLEQKEKFIKDAGTWRDISQDMRKEMTRLREENMDYNKKLKELTLQSIEDKKLIQKSIKNEKELRQMVTERANDFSEMYNKSLTQSKYIVSVADDMKAMRKNIDKLHKKLKIAEQDKLKAEQGVLMIAKEKLENEAAMAKKDIKIATLEKLCRALQAKASVNKLKNINAETENKIKEIKENQEKESSFSPRKEEKTDKAKPEPEEVSVEKSSDSGADNSVKTDAATTAQPENESQTEKQN